MLLRTARVLACWGVWFCLALPAWGGPVELAESPTDLRVFRVQSQITTRGKLVVTEGGGKTLDLPMQSQATFSFRERRLPPAGRDALAFRAVREFDAAAMRATVEGDESAVELPRASSLVATSGRIDGLQSYSLRTLLTDDQLDLLSFLADPLSLSAVLPTGEVDVDSEWLAPEWGAQLLTGVEAIESARLSGKVLSLDESAARLQLDGTVQGLQEGARTTVQVQGEVTYDVAGQYVRGARLTYKIVASIGAVATGVDAEVTVSLDREPSGEAGRITDELVAGIPLEAPPESLRLVFDAPPWRTRLKYARDWHVFRAVLDGSPRVAILRLLDQGSLLCQCNISPIPDAPPGQHTPLEQYQEDIRTVLGATFREFKSSDEVPLPGGGSRMTVVARGEVERTGKDKEGQPTALVIPMEWRYSIVADRSGRQMSFVFAIEQALAEQLADRDRELLDSLEFLR